ncbi:MULTISPECIES: sirohydrochlorin chelatase [unclassified Pseudomonas]|uniref:sirohydrochlorin chelatase n=1 Tax=unclassified Pseudomonas TaxID=196821 RepID=UPI002579E05D|nr:MULTISPECIES: sirohydrochlorin chelatase [unclassified Pseudomonas]
MTLSNSAPAILVVGHGTRSRPGVEEFFRLAEHLKSRFPDRLCTTGFLEFARPTIAEGLNKLIAEGARNITAIPGMLMAAGHAKNDIPSELNEFMAANPEVKITYGVELGVNAKMMRAARDRIEAAEAQFGDDYRRDETLLVVVGRGASDADANSNITKITRFLWEGMGFAWAETCYSGVTKPLVADALPVVHRLGYRNVIVFPYFLFTGRLIDRIYADVDAYAEAHPEVRVVKAGYLNDHPLVIEALVDKLHETEEGTGNMNCQLCHYREQIIGFEDRVGAPQFGHHHHVRGIGTDADHDHHHHHHHGHHHHDHEHGHSHDHALSPAQAAPLKAVQKLTPAD